MILESDIINSVQIPELIKDEFIRKGKVCLDRRGRPLHYSGGFALVFPFDIRGEKWAFRCWKADLGNIERRLSTLSRVLKDINLSYFCDFTYTPEGICVNGRLYPTTRMKWIEGYTLKDYICKNPQSKCIKKLADDFLNMCKALHSHHFAHGDLQHGNIMVNEDGELFLIDYDSVYIPQLGEQNDIIAGLADYQHPDRKNNKYSSEKLDYFSELIIYISLLAISENLSLIQEYDIENTEYLLFTKDDYLNLKSSKIYQDLSTMEGLFPLLLLILEEYLSKNNINDLEPFDKLLDSYTKTPVINEFIVENVENNIVYKNSKITLSWDVTNYNQIRLNGKPCKNFKFIDRVEADTTYVLEIINGLKITTEVLTVKVVDKPEITLKLRPSKIRKGSNEQSQLKWNVDNCISTKLLVDGIEKDINLTGAEIVNPERTTTYEIQAVGLDKRTTFTKKITLYVLSDSKIEFAVNKQYTYPRIPVLLNWNVQYAKFVELVGYGHVDHEGSKIIEIDKDEIFVLKVTDAFGVKTEQVHVKILPLPIINSLLVPMPQINHKTSININQTKLQPLVGIPTNLHTNISIPPLIEPNYETIKVEMNKPPVFHTYSLDLKGKSWWNKIWDRIRNIKGFKF